MDKKFLVLILLSSFILSSFSEVIKMPFYTKTFKYSELNYLRQLEEGTPKAPVVSDENIEMDCIEMCIGHPQPQCFQMVIQTGSFFMWVFNKEKMKVPYAFDTSLSSTLEKKLTEIVALYEDNTEVRGIQGIDYFYIQGKKIDKLNFILGEKANSFSEYQGMIGLGFNPGTFESQFSFIEQLYKKKLIYHKVFTQSFENDEKKGEISFGEIPKNIVEDYQHYGRCKALNIVKGDKHFKNPSWQCLITSVFFGDTYPGTKQIKYEDEKVSFFSFRRKALVPLKFFKVLKEDFLKELFEAGKCEEQLWRNHDTIFCNKDIEFNKKINLVFGDWAMSIDGLELFRLNKKQEKMEFALHHKKDYEKWSLGRNIARRFHMVYDIQNREIGFYNKEKVIKITGGPAEPPKVYEKLEEDAPIKPTKEEDKPINPYKPATPEYTEIGVIEEDITRKSGSQTSKVLKVLKILIIIALIIGALIFIVSFIRYRNKIKKRNGQSPYYQI